jgi:isoquinoline 1-oxidoreductase subunit beta
MASRISRRQFVAGSAGLTLGFAIDFRRKGARALAQQTSISPNVWLTIATDGTITIVSPAAEMGQGSMTGMPIVVAEELDADWAKVKVVQAPLNRAYGNPGFGGLQVTGASRTTPGFFMPLRVAGAQARRVLLDAVAKQWNVPVSELTTEPSVVVHAQSNRRIGYGDVARFAQVPAELPKITPADLKPTNRFRLIGQNLPRVELPEKITGKARFGIDVEVDGMVYGAVLRPPVPGSTPEAVDDSAARAVPGVTQVVKLPYGVGVVGAGYEAVHKAKAVLKVTWSKGAPAAGYNSDQVTGDYAAVAASLSRKGLPVFEQGDFSNGMTNAVRTFSALYLSDHVYHATMEPMNATARVSGDAVELWAPTQAPGINQVAIADVLKIPPEKVTVHTTLLGGGFGRRLEQDFVMDAVLLAKATGRSVKVIWSREDDVKNDKLRPLTAQWLEAGLDPSGNLSAWRHRIVAASIFARFNPGAYQALKGKEPPVIEGHELSYSVANQLHELFREERGYDVGFWRSVGVGYTKFAIESFIDEIARAQRIDPVAWRLRLLAHNARASMVVRRAAENSAWDRKRKGRALGIAMSDTWRSYIASVVEISLGRATGKIRVHKVWSVVDPGIVILPDNVVAQIEGATIFGVSHALQERITVTNGVVQQSNFNDYPLLRIADAPEVEVQVISTDNQPGGIGEVGLPPIAPAIGNALAALTGARVRRLPMLPERVLAAVKERRD